MISAASSELEDSQIRKVDFPLTNFPASLRLPLLTAESMHTPCFHLYSSNIRTYNESETKEKVWIVFSPYIFNIIFFRKNKKKNYEKEFEINK